MISINLGNIFMKINWVLLKSKEGHYELNLGVRTEEEGGILHVKKIELCDNAVDSFVRLAQLSELDFENVLVSSSEAAIAQIKEKNAAEAAASTDSAAS